MTAHVRDRRRDPFARVELEALRLIRDAIPKAGQQRARSVYLACCELAAEKRDYHGDGYEASLADIADRAGGMARNTVRAALQELGDLGLVVRERRAEDDGRDGASVIALLSVPGHIGGSTIDPQGSTIDPAPGQPLTPPRAGETSNTKRTTENTPPTPPASQGGTEDRTRSLMGGRKGSPRQRGASPRQQAAAAALAARVELAPATREQLQAFDALIARIAVAVPASTFEAIWGPVIVAGRGADGPLVLAGESAEWALTRHRVLIDQCLAVDGATLELRAIRSDEQPSQASTPTVDSRPMTATLGGAA